MSPLALMKEGETAEIVMFQEKHGQCHKHRHGHNHDLCCGRCDNCACRNSPAEDHLMNMGLRPGKQVEMITNSGSGPLVLLVDESRIAMSRSAAMKIYVRRNEK